MPVEPGSATGGLTASLHPPVLDVEPGGSASTELRVAGGGHATTDLRFEVLGDAATWSFVVPPVPGAGPASMVSARVVVRPPRAAVPSAGSSALALRVWVDGVDRVVSQTRAEGTVTIAPFTDIAASLEPRVGEGRSASQHELQVTNRGNASSTVTFGVTQGASLSVHLHDRTLVVPAGGAATTKVAVRPDNRLMRGPARAHPFRLEVTPEHGAAVSAMGEMRQQPLLGARSAVALAAVVLLGLIAAVAGSRATSSGPSPSDAGSTAAASDCPAAGHQDTFVSGLTPERIPTLPSSFSFSATRADGCSPVRFDPCQPIHYVVNPAQAPTTGVADVEEAFNRLARVTGMTFTNDGATDEVQRRGPYVPDRYPDRWAPILIMWTHQSGGRANIEVVGSGFPDRAQDVLVSGTLTLNSDAIVNRAKNTPVPGGFGSGGGPGIGAIGAESVTWGRVILHELAHIVGLGHTRDRDQLMYPDTAEQTSHTTDYRSGDREGLRWLGRSSGCLPATPTPGSTPIGPRS